MKLVNMIIKEVINGTMTTRNMEIKTDQTLYIIIMELKD